MRKGALSRICFCLAFCFFAQSLGAQNGFKYSVEIEAGAGIKKGPRSLVSAEFTAAYSFNGGFEAGCGVGIRNAEPCFQYIIKNGTPTKKSFCDEQDLPIFARIGYIKDWFIANIDAGYSFGLYGRYKKDWLPGGQREPCYSGPFIHPRVGVRFGVRSKLSLGVLLQNSTVSTHVETETGTWGDPSWSSVSVVSTQQELTPALTLSYGICF